VTGKDYKVWIESPNSVDSSNCYSAKACRNISGYASATYLGDDYDMCWDTTEPPGVIDNYDMTFRFTEAVAAVAVKGGTAQMVGAMQQAGII
jgi:hypothetical protein